MAPKPESTAKLAPLGREFRGVGMAGAYTRELFWRAFKDSLAKFDPRVQIHNPVMFVVWVGTLVTLALTIDPGLFGPSPAGLPRAWRRHHRPRRAVARTNQRPLRLFWSWFPRHLL
jgi:hypothetical protein